MRAPLLSRPTLLVIVALAMGACSDSSAAQQPQTSSSTTATIPAVTSTSPSPSPTASTDPATAAKAAYVRYVQAVDRAYGNPEKATREQLSQVATSGALTFLLSQVEAMRGDRVHQQGSLRIKKMSITSVSPASGRRLAQVFLKACLNYSHRIYVDATGKPVFPAERGSGLAQATVNMVLVSGHWLVADEQNPPVKSC